MKKVATKEVWSRLRGIFKVESSVMKPLRCRDVNLMSRRGSVNEATREVSTSK